MKESKTIISGGEFEQIVLNADKVEEALTHGAEWIANLPNGKCIVKRRKTIIIEDDTATNLLRQLENSQSTWGLTEGLQAQFNAIQVR